MACRNRSGSSTAQEVQQRRWRTFLCYFVTRLLAKQNQYIKHAPRCPQHVSNVSLSATLPLSRYHTSHLSSLSFAVCHLNWLWPGKRSTMEQSPTKIMNVNKLWQEIKISEDYGKWQRCGQRINRKMKKTQDTGSGCERCAGKIPCVGKYFN